MEVSGRGGDGYKLGDIDRRKIGESVEAQG